MKAVSFTEFWTGGPAQTYSDAELLLFVISGGNSPSAMALQMANTLLDRFGGWREVLSARPDDLISVPGFGPEKLHRVAILAELIRRLAKPRLVMTKSAELAAALREVLPPFQESVAVALLNSDQSLIRVQEIFRGSVSECFAQPREIMREALRAGAAKLVVSHNHVAGEVLPSEADVRFTTRLEWAAKLIGIPLLDHLIVSAGGEFFSFADAGLMKPRPRRRRRVV